MGWWCLVVCGGVTGGMVVCGSEMVVRGGGMVVCGSEMVVCGGGMVV